MTVRDILSKNKTLTPAEAEFIAKIFDKLIVLLFGGRINAIDGVAIKGFSTRGALSFLLGLSEFAVIFRKDNGIEAMWDYVVWCERHHALDGMLETILHDVNDRDEKFMSPRTSGYLGVNTEELGDDEP